MKALDSLSLLEQALTEAGGESFKKRPSGQDLRFHLVRLTKDGGLLSKCEAKMVSEFIEVYYHARHEPLPVFTVSHYERFTSLLEYLMTNIINLRSSAKKRNVTFPSSGSPKATSVSVNGKTKILTNAAESDANETSV